MGWYINKVYHNNCVSIRGVIMSSIHFRSQCQVGRLIFKTIFKTSSIDGMPALTSNLSILLYSCLISSDFCWIWGRLSFTIWDVSLRIYRGKKQLIWGTYKEIKPPKHQVVEDKERKWDYHIQHSNKLIYSGQHFLQTLLQTQDLDEISEITI